ncbi:hypothetical protein PR202_ga17906 [Eleusine coracana subsp. coracana]|uniref:Solute-binding protein family 3/N-terminal domain-containing protein n=1 Tax=Eleusine coracana subsp. coracana TaxID=191504 RepID=A0AAV5CRA8_ELECO|nr:hypothetical protein PR202_ga17906 [Eleusine coracana subsp. coracana]
MKWPARSCQITIVLLVFLALGDASAAAPGADGALDVSRHARRKSLEGRTMAYHADLHVSYSSQDARASTHDDAKRTDTRELARRNSGAVFSGDERKLRIAVPRIHGFQAFVNLSIEVFEKALDKLNNPPKYDFYVFDGTYDDLVLSVSNKDYDAAVGDVTITAERVTKAEFTMPYIQTPGLGFVFPLGSPVVHNLSAAILNLTQGSEMSEIEMRWLGRSALSTGDDSPVADFEPLTLRSFSGLFVITGCISTLMLLIRIVRSVYARYYTRIRGSGLQNSDVEDGSAILGESSVALRDDMGSGSAPDQSHNEDRSEHSVQADGSRMCVGNAEHCQIHEGAVPADFVRIEMSITGQGVDLVT